MPDLPGVVSLQAVILAGGAGTRLAGRLPPGLPKILADVGGRPLADYLLCRLARAGVTRVIFAAGFGAEALRRYASSLHGREGVPAVDFSVEREPLGTGGAAREALRRADPGAVLVMNGDVLTESPPDLLWHGHRLSGACVTVACARVADGGRFGETLTDAAGLITGFLERGRAGVPCLINAGMYVLPHDFFDRFAPPAARAGACSLERDVLPVALPAARARACLLHGGFLDVGIPEDLDRAPALAAQWRVPAFPSG